MKRYLILGLLALLATIGAGCAQSEPIPSPTSTLIPVPTETSTPVATPTSTPTPTPQPVAGTPIPANTLTPTLARGPQPTFTPTPMPTPTPAPSSIAPQAPTNVTATADNGEVMVTWSTPPSDGGSSITGYTVTWDPEGHTASVDGATNEAAVMGLTSGQVYIFTVRAINAVGTGPASAPSNPVMPTGVFVPTGNLVMARAIHDAVLLLEGKVLIVGGLDQSGADLTSAEIYDPATGIFASAGSLKTGLPGRRHHTTTLLQNGDSLITGGHNYCCIMAAAEPYNSSTGTFSPTGSLAPNRYEHTATLLRDGNTIIIGGNARQIGVTASAEIYDLSTRTFTFTGSMTKGRADHTATLLSDGRVLVIGGLDASAELYEPTIETFTLTGSMTTRRAGHTATLLPNGKILVAGGWSSRDTTERALASVELYHPATSTFTPTGSLATGRGMHTATLLQDGKVLITGGASSSIFFASSELYDPYSTGDK